MQLAAQQRSSRTERRYHEIRLLVTHPWVLAFINGPDLPADELTKRLTVVLDKVEQGQEPEPEEREFASVCLRAMSKVSLAELSRTPWGHSFAA